MVTAGGFGTIIKFIFPEELEYKTKQRSRKLV